MITVFVVNNVDYDTPEAAIKAAETLGSAGVVKFIGEPNLPGCWPAIRYRSTALWKYEDGVWTQYSIHDGTAESINNTKPH